MNKIHTTHHHFSHNLKLLSHQSYKITDLMIAAGVIFTVSLVQASASSQTKFVIDTDAGADDAQGLAYAIFAAGDQIDAITIVPGNADAVTGARNIYRIRKLMNATHIPIYIGARRPMVNALEPSSFFGNDSFGDVPGLEPRYSQDAPDGLRQILRRGSAVRAIINRAHVYPSKMFGGCGFWSRD